MIVSIPGPPIRVASRLVLSTILSFPPSCRFTFKPVTLLIVSVVPRLWKNVFPPFAVKRTKMPSLLVDRQRTAALSEIDFVRRRGAPRGRFKSAERLIDDVQVGRSEGHFPNGDRPAVDGGRLAGHQRGRRRRAFDHDGGHVAGLEALAVQTDRVGAGHEGVSWAERIGRTVNQLRSYPLARKWQGNTRDLQPEDPVSYFFTSQQTSTSMSRT